MQHMVPVVGYFQLGLGEKKKLALWMCTVGFNVLSLLAAPPPQCLSRTATERSWARWVWSCTTWVRSWFSSTVTCSEVVRRAASASPNFASVIPLRMMLCFPTELSMHRQVTNSLKVLSGTPSQQDSLNGFISCFHPIKTHEKTHKVEP